MADAATALAAGLRGIRDTHGPGAILFLTSPRVSSEAAWLFASVAKAVRLSLRLPGRGPPARRASGRRRVVRPQHLDGETGRRPPCGRGRDRRRARRCLQSGVRVFDLPRGAERAAWIHIGPAPTAWKRMVTLHLDCTAGEEAATLRRSAAPSWPRGPTMQRAWRRSLMGRRSYRTRSGSPGRRWRRPPPSSATPRSGSSLRSTRMLRWGATTPTSGGQPISRCSRATGGVKGGLLVVKNDANGQGVQDVLYGGGFTSAADLEKAKSLSPPGRSKRLFCWVWIRRASMASRPPSARRTSRRRSTCSGLLRPIEPMSLSRCARSRKRMAAWCPSTAGSPRFGRCSSR